ncbi:MAG: Na/Pi cotransporter family protein [Gemmatimonadetes bacterium]|jgi:phosphate:Na+ symporter|nr:Na/Pi cotransporter family protein [Gemmatimonadota bacterium]MBT6143966.1 Na/Pi cotransporter family protein [Gemmatimonadota bacterium]MBT7863335.1 Na/Pi cotransporter family protein [Gemmatimonadota bacterium]
MDTASTALELGPLLMGLLGGLALFLFGMEQMTDALKAVAGGGMKSLLARMTTNRFKAAFAGAFVTAVIQSSSVTTVLVVGFISAGVLSVSQSIGIIMGANVGTTITAQIIAFKVTHYAMLLIAAGFGAQFLSKRETVRRYGLMMMGLGLVFFGMNHMSDATRPLRTYQPFIDLMQDMSHPLTGVLIGASFTALVQSSSATTGVIIVLASQGFITLEAGIALAFGANLGTCITALLAAIGKPREAIRAAAIHVLFNVLGVLIWFLFIPQLADVVRSFSPKAVDLEGVARLAAETPRQIANAHTIFNVSNTLIFIWFTGPLARLVQRLVPDPDEELARRPSVLDEGLLQTPELAFDLVRMELGRLGASAVGMVREAMQSVVHGSGEDLAHLEQMDAEVDTLHGELIAYMGQLSQEHLTGEQIERLHGYMSVANSIESIGDIVETNLTEVGTQRLRHNLQISQSTQEVLDPLNREVCRAVEMSMEALVTGQRELAADVETAKGTINELAAEAERHLAIRLTAAEPDRVVMFRLESEAIEYLKRVYYFAKRIAKVTIEVSDHPSMPDPTDD